MYKITGQAINLRYIAKEINLVEALSEESKQIIKICEFGKIMKAKYLAYNLVKSPNLIRIINAKTSYPDTTILYLLENCKF